MISEPMEVEAQAIAEDSNSKVEAIGKEPPKTFDVNENIVDVPEESNGEESADEEDKKESSDRSLEKHLDEEKKGAKDVAKDKELPKVQYNPKEMDIVRAIKALKEKHGSSVNAIKSQLEKQVEKTGDCGVSKKKVLKILQRGIKQQFFHMRDEKYKLTEKGRKLGGKSDQNNSPTKKKDEKTPKTEKISANHQANENTTKNVINDSTNEDEEKVKDNGKKVDSQEVDDRSRHDLTTREMIGFALNSGDPKKGMSLQQIQLFVEKKYKLGNRHNEVIKKTLKKGIQKKVYVNENGNYKLSNKERGKLPVEKVSKSHEESISNEKKDPLKEDKSKAHKNTPISTEIKNHKDEKELTMGNIVLNAIIDLEKLTREGSSVGKIKEEMVSKYKLDKNKFDQFLKDGIKRRGMKKIDKKSK